MSVIEPNDGVNAGKAKQADGRRLAFLRKSVPSAGCLVGWFRLFWGVS